MAKRLLLTQVVLASLLSVGCSTVGGLEGKVFLNDEKVPTGQVLAFNPKNEVIGSAVIIDGLYELENLPPGPATVVVQTHQPGGGPLGIAAMPPPGPLEPALPPGVLQDRIKQLPEKIQKLLEALKPVPLKYTDCKQSDLKVNVALGRKTFDIKMSGTGEIPPRPEGPSVPPGGPVPPPR